MSISVDVSELAETLSSFDLAYLLTTSGEGRIKVVSTRAELLDGELIVRAPGRGSLANAGLTRSVTLLYPPLHPGGMSLLVDGTAVVADAAVRITPTSAVLHKSAD